MRIRAIQSFILGFLLFSSHFALYAAPAFSRGTSIQGVIVYQDAADKTQFWYLPTTSDELLGERLRAYRVIHFGFGKPYYVQDDQGEYRNVSGGIISGTFAYDLSAKKREEIVKAINEAFHIRSPKLLPIPLRSPKISSVLLEGVFGKFGKVEQRLPTGFQIGPEESFAAGSATSIFGAVLANAQVGKGIQPNPTFSLNIDANAEFVGDPWTFDVECDLAQVWKEVRKHGGASVNIGWFRIGSAEYQGIWRDLNKTNVCKFTQVEGSLDTATYGRQIAETMKQIFQAVNDKAVNGESFFRFEPNPEAPPPGGGGGFSLFGFSIGVNLGYSEAFFSQSISFRRRASYTGRLEAPIAFSAVMAVACGPETKQYFTDLGDSSESCITQPKIDTFLARAQRERDAKRRKLLELVDRLTRHEITETEYEKIKHLYDEIDFTDTFFSAPAPVFSLGQQPPNRGKRNAVTFVSELSDEQIKQIEARALKMRTVPNKPMPTVRLLSKGKE